ncbi:MAG: hypothetical protein V2A76_04020 [Planctomycetota bacterium]
MPKCICDAHRTADHGTGVTGFRGAFKGIWMLLVLAALPSSSASAGGPPLVPTEVSYQFIRPESPDDLFSLRYLVPPGFKSAIVICDQPKSLAGQAAPAGSVDWSRALLLLPPDSGSGLVGVDGRLPANIKPLELSRSLVQVRILLADRAANTYLISGPIPLGHEIPINELDQEEPSTNDPAADTIMTVADLGLTEQPGEEAEAPPEDNSDTITGSSHLLGLDTLVSQPFSYLPLTSLAGGGLIWFSSHDQPIPIQGSGH